MRSSYLLPGICPVGAVRDSRGGGTQKATPAPSPTLADLPSREASTGPSLHVRRPGRRKLVGRYLRPRYSDPVHRGARFFYSCRGRAPPCRPRAGGWWQHASRCLLVAVGVARDRRATPSLLASAACMCQSRRVDRQQGRLLPRKQFPPVSPAAAPRRSPRHRGAGASPEVRAGARGVRHTVAKRRRRGAVVARGSDVSNFPATATPTALGVATAPAGLRVGLEAEAAPLAESRMAMEMAESVAAFLVLSLEL